MLTVSVISDAQVTTALQVSLIPDQTEDRCYGLVVLQEQDYKEEILRTYQKRSVFNAKHGCFER